MNSGIFKMIDDAKKEYVKTKELAMHMFSAGMRFSDIASLLGMPDITVDTMINPYCEDLEWYKSEPKEKCLHCNNFIHPDFSWCPFCGESNSGKVGRAEEILRLVLAGDQIKDIANNYKVTMTRVTQICVKKVAKLGLTVTTLKEMKNSSEYLLSAMDKAA